MKTHILFCYLLTIITFCVFTWKAETILGQVLGFTALAISMAAIGKIFIGKLDID